MCTAVHPVALAAVVCWSVAAHYTVCDPGWRPRAGRHPDSLRIRARAVAAPELLTDGRTEYVGDVHGRTDVDAGDRLRDAAADLVLVLGTHNDLGSVEATSERLLGREGDRCLASIF